MYKKWLSCALSVLCSFCLFWGLYSNTLEVKAATTLQNISGSFDLYPNGIGLGSSGYISNGSGTIAVTSVSTGEFHICIPLSFRQQLSNFTFSKSGDALLNSFVTYGGRFTMPSFSFGSSKVYDGEFKNICLTDSNHNLVLNQSGDLGKHTVYGKEIFDGDLQYSNICYFLEFDVGFSSYVFEYGVKIQYSGGSFYANIRDATSGEIASSFTKVSDDAANQSLDAIEQSSQQIATSVTSDTGGGLLATIKNFFGGFFSNLINSILGLFVPDSTYFSTWFDNLNTLLSAKLGMLYAPFDLLLSTLNAVYSADTTEPGITFPGITWDGQTVIEPYTFYFSSLGEDFQNLRDAVYFGTDVVFLFAFMHLLQKKIALVITGSEVNG